MTDALARTDDPATAHAAARAVTPQVEALQRRVLETLSRHTVGLTTHEIAWITKLEWGSVTPRMKPLRELGLVISIGTRVPVGRKRPCIVFAITGAGVESLRSDTGSE